MEELYAICPSSSDTVKASLIHGLFLPQLARRLWHWLPEPWRDRLRTSPSLLALRNAWRRLHGLGSAEDEIYFQEVDETTRASAPAIADAIVDTFAPKTVFEAGCGTGALIDQLRSRGVRVKGVDCSPVALRYCRQRSLDVTQCDLNRGLPDDYEPVDLAICVEVAHQLPPQSADRLVWSLCRLARVVVFSSNTPGSGDRVRLNEQPHDWWIDRFRSHGFHHNQNITNRSRGQWRQASTAPWFSANTLVFQRQAT